MPQSLLLADWLEELAVFGTPSHILAAETAHHLCQAIRHAYLAKLGLSRKHSRRQIATQDLDADLQPKRIVLRHKCNKIGAS